MKKPFHDIGLLILRLGFGGMMLTHGIPKLNMLYNPSEFADPIGVGPTISLILVLIGEVVAPIFMIIGFKTRWAAIPSMITMLVAAFVVHLQDGLGTKELALLYLFAFTVILLSGAGKHSIDKK